MAKDINVNSIEWCDLIFEGKNKDYGAYELRKHSARRHLTAYFVIIGCVILAMVLPAFIRFLTPVKTQEKMVTVTELSDLKMDLPEYQEKRHSYNLQMDRQQCTSTDVGKSPIWIRKRMLQKQKILVVS